MPGEFHLSGTVDQFTMNTPTAEQLAALTGLTIDLICNIPAGTQLPTTGGVFVVGPRQVTVLPTGQISEDGVNDGIMLLANDPALGLNNPVQWTFKPGRTAVGTKTSVKLVEWTFEAPAPGDNRTLDELAPVPNVDAFPVGSIDISDVAGLSDALAGKQPLLKGIYVDDHGADPTGATSSNTAIAAARTALGSSPGVLVFGTGTYTFTTPIATFGPYQGIVGQGRGETILKFSGTGDAIRAVDPRATAGTFMAALPGGAGGPGFGGPFVGFSIDGTGSGSNSCGIHAGDLHSLVIDVAIHNFTNTGGKGLWLDNRYTWTERSNIDVSVTNCLNCVYFDVNGGTTSFEYSDFNLSVYCLANQNGVVLNGDANIVGRFRLYGNFQPDTTNTGAVLKIGSSSGSLAYIYGDVDIHVETVGTGTTHTDLQINGSQGYIRGRGIMRYNHSGTDFQSGNAFGKVNIIGPVNTPSLGVMDLTQAGRVMGMLGLNWGYLGPTGDWWPGLGNIFLRQMTAGAQTLSINFYQQPTNAAGEFLVGIQQPASGSTTLTWPGTFHWVDGSAPTLSTTPGAIDWFHIWTPDFGTYYIKHLNNQAGDLRFSAIDDVNGNSALDISATASAVNRIRLHNAAAGGWPSLESVGPDGGQSVAWSPTGFYAWMGSNPAFDFAVDGSLTAVGFNFQTKGGAPAQVNGVPVIVSHPRIGTVTSNATPAINTDNVDQVNITALAVAVTSMTSNLTGTPADGQLLDVRFKDSGTARAITWGASFTGTLLSTTVANKTHLQRLKYDAAAAKWAGYLADTAGY